MALCCCLRCSGAVLLRLRGDSFAAMCGFTWVDDDAEEAKRQVAAGGLYLNGVQVRQVERAIELADFEKGSAVLRKGKKHHLVLRLETEVQ